MATIDIPDRMCSHCGGTRWDVNVLKNKYYCSKRRLEQDAIRRKNNPAHFNTLSTNHRKNNPDSCKKSAAKSYIKNKAKRLAYHKQHTSKPDIRDRINFNSRKNIEKLTDHIVKNMIRHQFNNKSIKACDISEELIELKRKQIILTRKIRNHEKDKNSNNQ